MGGGRYSCDVAYEARSTNRDIFSYRGYATDSDAASARRSVHPILDIRGKVRECVNDTAIVVALDVTRSRGKDTKIIYEKLPLLMGELERHAYLSGLAISFVAVGDATSDGAPLQVGQFEADNRLDEVLSKFWIEEGGGGTGQESYELAAYYFARRTKIDCLAKGTKGYFFFVGDEGFYPKVDKEAIQRVCGVTEPASIDSAKIFAELQEKFHTFLIYPQKSWEDRKSDIDAEMKQRVEAAGGQYKNVDFRASLLWNNRNDVDLHVITPEGEEIYYGHKRSTCGGWLDVDMNVHGDSIKPVENVRWSRGQAQKGDYKVYIQNFRFHEQKHSPTEYRVEVEVNGKIEQFEGVIGANGETGRGSDVHIGTFHFDPSDRVAERTETPDTYESYSDEKIKAQWASVLPAEHILLIEDPKAIIDVLLGAMAITAGASDLDKYLQDMKSRNQSDVRMAQTARALAGVIGRHAPTTRVAFENVPKDGSVKQRGGTSRRL